MRVQKSRARASKQSLHEAAAALLLPQRASAYWCWCGDGVGGGGAGANATHEGPCRVCCEGSEKVVADLVVVAKVMALEVVVVVVAVA